MCHWINKAPSNPCMCWDLNFNPPVETYTGMAVVKENIITDSKICSAGKW